VLGGVGVSVSYFYPQLIFSSFLVRIVEKRKENIEIEYLRVPTPTYFLKTSPSPDPD
jgi:hypothetical protein